MCLVSTPAARREQRESIILKGHRRRVHYVIEGLVGGGTDDPSVSVVRIIMCEGREVRAETREQRVTVTTNEALHRFMS